MASKTDGTEGADALPNPGAWSDAVLREQIEAAGLDRKDAALCTTLCCGRAAKQGAAGLLY